jgi:hypothetical protein
VVGEREVTNPETSDQALSKVLDDSVVEDVDVVGKAGEYPTRRCHIEKARGTLEDVRQ